jgi:cytochrome c peroxidase
MVTHNRADIGAFRTPLILNVGITAPYMHDGSLATLWDVIDHYNAGGRANLFLDGGIEPLALTEEEIDQLVAFLFSLTDGAFAEENLRQFERQKTLASKQRPERDEAMAMRRTIPFEDRVAGAKETDQ